MTKYLPIVYLTLAAVAANALGVVFTVVANNLILAPVLQAGTGPGGFSSALALLISAVAFPGVTVLSLWYVAPLIRFLRDGLPPAGGARERLFRRAVNFPLAISVFSCLPWLAAPAVVFSQDAVDAFANYTIYVTLIAGLITVIAGFMALEMVFRRVVAPLVFPGGKIHGVRGGLRFRLRTRMFLLAAAISFLPFVIVLLFIFAHQGHTRAGMDPAVALDALAINSLGMLIVFALITLALTWLFANNVSAVLREMEDVTERVGEADYSRRVRVVSNDELGVLGDALNAMIAGLSDRARILDEFGRLVDPSVRDYLLSQDGLLAGRKKEAAILFSDIRSFTALSERNAPEQVFALLNRHFSNLAGVIARNGGTVDKFVGDAVMAVFGLLDDDPPEAQATRALRACLEIRAAQAELNARLEREGLPPIRIGVGVHLGEVLAGKLGSADRHDYTVIGDAVNVAARVEAFTRKLDTDILVTDRVLRLSSEPVPSRNSARVELRGRTEPILVHAI